MHRTGPPLGKGLDIAFLWPAFEHRLHVGQCHPGCRLHGHFGLGFDRMAVDHLNADTQLSVWGAWEARLQLIQ